MAIKLCNICNKRFSGYFEEGECYICSNEIEGLLEKVKKVKPKKGIKYFSIANSIPKQWLIKEEDVFDIKFGESVKYQLNRLIREIIEEKGLKYQPDDGDVIIKISKEGVEIEDGDLFLYGIYKKLIPNISQKRWKKYKESVEQIIGEIAKEKTKSQAYFLHASGREDADAINIGGRPFVLELNKAKIRDERVIKEIEEEVNKTRKVEVEIKGRVRRSFTTLVSDSHFDKLYKAYVESLDEISEEELKKRLEKAAKEMAGISIAQKTPLRVLKRRADKWRKRKIYEVKVGEDEKGIFLEIKAEAGAYIKELISGDKGRTQPSFSSLTGLRLRCRFLIVKAIYYSFLESVFSYARL